MPRQADSLNVAREAITAEIARLDKESARLSGILAALGSATNGSLPTIRVGKKRGRKPKNPGASTGDLSAALDYIQSAGKGGINARSLASLMSQAGLQKPHKTVLLESGKVKKTGKGGGTTYVWVG